MHDRGHGDAGEDDGREDGERDLELRVAVGLLGDVLAAVLELEHDVADDAEDDDADDAGDVEHRPLQVVDLPGVLALRVEGVLRCVLRAAGRGTAGAPTASAASGQRRRRVEGISPRVLTVASLRSMIRAPAT